MSDQALAIIGQQSGTAIQKAGAGIDFNSKFFTNLIDTVSINQPTTTIEGAIAGKLRIGGTGDQFEHMYVTLLAMPKEGRDYHVGPPGELIRKPENLMCFSRDMEKPDAKAKAPQSISCNGCPKADWSKWRQTGSKADIPPCDAYYYAVFIDTVYKLPLQMWIRGANKAPFEAGMKNIARTLMRAQSQGQTPNIYDVSFRLSTERQKGKPNFILKMDNFKTISEAERAQFGDVFLRYTNRGKAANQPTPEEEAAKGAAEQMENANAAIDAQVVAPGSESNVVEGEIVI